MGHGAKQLSMRCDIRQLALAGAHLLRSQHFHSFAAASMGRNIATADDPVKITDRALDDLQHDVAEREIRAALAAGDSDLAQSFLELAGRSRSLDPALGRSGEGREGESGIR